MDEIFAKYYSNSLIHTLYMPSELRELICKFFDGDEKYSRKKLFIHLLQKLFSCMKLLISAYAKNLTETVSELSYVLFDHLERQSQGADIRIENIQQHKEYFIFVLSLPYLVRRWTFNYHISQIAKINEQTELNSVGDREAIE